MFLLAVSATGFIGLIALLTTAWLSQRAAEAPPPPVAHLISNHEFDAVAYYDGKTYCRARFVAVWYSKQTGALVGGCISSRLDRAVRESIHAQETASRLERMGDL